MNAPTKDASERKRGRILPRDAGAASLDIVIGVMALLAALALGGMLIAHRTTEGWQSGLIGRMTVQILPDGAAPPEREVQAALSLLRATSGIVSASALSDRDNMSLVAPWLGSDAVIGELPFPRLIDVRLAPGANLDVSALAKNLKAAAPHSVLDDHARWLDRLRATAAAFLLSATAILALIAFATAATVAFATRAGLAAHHEIVELLHLMGAKDRFIARSFEWHYFLGALIAATAGTLVAAAAFLTAGGLDQIGLASVHFLPPLGLKLEELPWLLSVPVAAAFIAWGTARLSVVSALRAFY